MKLNLCLAVKCLVSSMLQSLSESLPKLLLPTPLPPTHFKGDFQLSQDPLPARSVRSESCTQSLKPKGSIKMNTYFIDT